MDVFRVRKIRETTSSNTTTGTLDSVHRDIVQSLQELTEKQETLKTELEETRSRISVLHVKNDLADILEANKLQARMREIEKELASGNPVEDYYIKNMDILIEYYKKQDSVSAMPTAMPKDTNTFLS